MPSDTYEIEYDPFYITRGDDFTLTIDFGGEDVSEYQYAAHVREEPEAEDFIPFSVDMTLAASGFVRIFLTDEQTRAMTIDRYVFDFQETSPSGIIDTIFAGDIRMREDVTK